MAQIIDFESRKKLMEQKKGTVSQKFSPSFSAVSQQNKLAKEKLRKEREQANKNVMKSYKIK